MKELIIIPLAAAAAYFIAKKIAKDISVQSGAAQVEHFNWFTGFFTDFAGSIGMDSIAYQKALDHIMLREGYRDHVYKDSLDKLTGGWGHLILPSDNLVLGSEVSEALAKAWLKADAKNAYEAAKKQAAELKIPDPDFVVALTSVNYQLGTGWRNKFPNTWANLKAGNWQAAISGIESSAWARQTPVRVADFKNAIIEAYA